MPVAGLLACLPGLPGLLDGLVDRWHGLPGSLGPWMGGGYALAGLAVLPPPAFRGPGFAVGGPVYPVVAVLAVGWGLVLGWVAGAAC